jgi:5'-deoxynucleotidase
MTRLTLAQRLRCAHVKRWSMVRVLREQNLAEHLMLVQIVALETVDRYLSGPNHVANPDKLRADVMEWAMWHDMPEVITGDVPTPMKKFVAAHGGPTLLHAIEQQVDGRHYELSKSVGETALLIVKFADLYEAIHFLHWEGHGPRATEISMGLMVRMKKHIAHTGAAMMPELAEVFENIYRDMTYDSNE